MNSAPKLRIGILGAGQLALMLAEAARPLDIGIVCAGQAGDCAEQVAEVLEVDLEDAAAVARFAAGVDLVTIESENIDAAVLEGLHLFPNAGAVGIAQDRLLEKRFFRSCGIGTAPFMQVNDLASLRAAIGTIGVPSILKTRRMGYDGKGQVRLHVTDELEAAWEAVGMAPCILEGMVPFQVEVSLIASRSAGGQTVFYPLIRNEHRAGILRTSIAPYEDARLQGQAESCMSELLLKLDYVGVLAVEFFVVDGELLANEMASRVHNSGHWTIEGSASSQFENHLRAIAGLSLGATESRPTVMLNCIGTMPPPEATGSFPSLWRHDYGKQPRPGRKVGHLTFPADATEAIAYWQHRFANEP